MSERPLKASFVYNLVGSALPRIVGLVTVPLYVAQIGAARYGALAIVWLLLGYFGVFDFGLSRASANALARLGQASTNERAKVFMSSIYITFLLGAIGAGIIYIIGGFFLEHFFQLSKDLKAEVDAAFPWIACLLPLSLLAGVSRGAIQAREHFLALNILDAASSLLGQVVPLLCAVFISPALYVLIPATFASAAVCVGLGFLYIALTDKIIVASQVCDWGKLKELFHFGAWVTASNLAAATLMSLDQPLVGSMLGAAAVAYYVVPMTLVTRSQVIATAMATTLFPRFSRQNSTEAIELGERMVVSIGYLFGALCVPAIILGGPFMKLWMGPEFAASSIPVLRLLLVGTWVNSTTFVPFALLVAQRRPDVVAKLAILELLPFLLVLWLLVHNYGLAGAALAWNARAAVDAFLVFKIARFDFCYLARLLPVSILLIVGYGIAPLANASIFWSMLALVLLFVCVSGSALLFDRTSRGLARMLYNRVVEAVA